jgi:endonuclease/exonuclease/phosphatase (EEP) superfamily protein YafD
MSRVMKALGWLQTALWIVLLLGVVLHTTIRDRYALPGVLFYALPLPLLAVLGILLAGWPVAKQKHRLMALACAVLLTVIWCSKSWRTGPAQEEKITTGPMQEFRVMFWNLSRPDTASQPLIDLVKRHQPDVIGCVEAGDQFHVHRATYEHALPGYECHALPGNLLLLSRHTVQVHDRGRLDKKGAFAAFDIRLNRRTARLVLADVWADPLMPRKPSLDQALAQSGSDPHALIMGDFNTPRESVHFAPYETARLRHAYDVAGKGFRETWFWGLPVLSIDHIWCGAEWHIIETVRLRDWSSDHDVLMVRLQ